MCGLFIVINRNKKKININKANNALKILMSRGPDWNIKKIINEKIFFSQSVLSMTGEEKKNINLHYSFSKRFFILFNGEIYNYRELASSLAQNKFDFKSDTNVLVNFFEFYKVKDIYSKLDGMYSFAIFDKVKNKIIICRDPQGEKSLYYYKDNEKLIFSSEINPIKHYLGKANLDINQAKNYFYTRHLTEFSHSNLKNIKIFPQGSVLEYCINSNSCKFIEKFDLDSYINEKDFKDNSKKTLDDLSDELDFLLKKNLKQMIPNRKFASVVSGGIDSSLISKYLSELSNNVEFVSLNCKGKDELNSNLHKFEKYLNRKIKVFNINQNDYYQSLLKSILICNSPVNSHSFVSQYILTKKIKEFTKCKALFGGEGADELFGGYKTYNQKILDVNKNYSDYSKIVDFKIFKKDKDYYNFENLLKKKWNNCLYKYKFIKNLKYRNRMSMMLMDSLVQLPSNGLRGCDLMSMGNSIESRSVFLRKDIVKFALNLPLKFKLNNKNKGNFNSKIILKKLFEKKFNKKLIFKKQGFPGFPNETSVFLGPKKDYLFFKYFKRHLISKNEKKNNKALEWKIINTEYFLRLLKQKNEI